MIEPPEHVAVVPDDPAHREPPHSLEAEVGVLGSLLQDIATLALIGDLLEPRSFFSLVNQAVYAAIVAVAGRNEPVDVVTVHEEVCRCGVDDDYRGMGYLFEIVGQVASARNARRYAEIVAERFVERQLIAAAARATDLAWQSKIPIADRLDLIAGALAQVEQQRSGPGRRVPVLSLAALKQASERIRWQVKHVIPRSSIGMLFGGSGTFKSFLAVDLALHVAHGMPWMGRRTDAGEVLYIAAEGGAGLWGRVEAWHRQRRMRWDGVPLYVVPQAVDLTVDSWRVVEAAQAVGAQPSLVIVDTLSQTYAGEENSASEMAAYLREIGLRMRALWDCAVLLIHHTGHEATERPRGSSAIRGNVDFLIGAFRDEKEMIATVVCKKQKDGDLFGDASFRLDVVELGRDEDNDLVTSLVARHISTAEELAKARADEAAAGRGGRNHAFLALLDDCIEEKSLRRAYYELLGPIAQAAKKKAYARAKAWAIDAGYMELIEGRVIDRRGARP